MAEHSIIARPYARAAFEFAGESKSHERWSKLLAALAELVASDEVRPLLAHPMVPPADVGAALCDALGKSLDEAGRNFVRLLAENRRLAAAPAIARQFETLRAEAEGRVEVELRSAMKVDQAAQKRVAEALKRRLGRDIDLKVVTDESLIGGALIRAGDLVIDGSVKGRLDRLAAAMSH
jgi:F-type H+-transporting ATPase subunit delta